MDIPVPLGKWLSQILHLALGEGSEFLVDSGPRDFLSIDLLGQSLPISVKKISKIMRRVDCWLMTSGWGLLEDLSLISFRLSQYVNMVEEEAQDYFRRVQELCTLMNCSPPDESYLYILGLVSLTGDAIAQWKYAVNRIFCDHYRLEKPVKKPYFIGDHLLPRALRIEYHKLRSERIRLRMKTQVQVYTLFQGFKKGLLPARLEQVAQSLKDHAAALSRRDKVTPPEILQEVERILLELFDADEPGMAFGFILDSKCAPKVSDERFSRKATMQMNYMQGGNVGFILRCFNHWRQGVVRPLEFLGYSDNTSSDRWQEPIACYGAFYSKQECFDLMEDLARGDTAGFHVNPNCILEPMKVRIITKPRVGNYFGFRLTQKTLWRACRNHPSGFFSLIGQPLNKKHLSRIIRSWRRGKSFCSGDFKASTDNLNADFSRLVAHTLLKHVSREQYKRCMDSLFNTTVHYDANALPRDERYGVDTPCKHKKLCEALLKRANVPSEILQTDGQLMGNPLSFPVLCLANYVSYHISCERREGGLLKWRDVLEKYPVLINGDDILFCGDEEHYAIWRAVTTSVGLEPSVGKNLFSSDILQINSELYTVRECNFSPPSVLPEEVFESQESWVCVRKVHYVNFGLLTFRKKQDCAKDLTVVSKSVQRFDPEDVSDPLWYRVKNVLKLKQALFFGLPDLLCDRVRGIWRKHLQPCEVRFPSLPWNEVWEEGPQEEFGLDFLLSRMFRNLNGSLVRYGNEAPTLMLLPPLYEPDRELRKARRLVRDRRNNQQVSACTSSQWKRTPTVMSVEEYRQLQARVRVRCNQPSKEVIDYVRTNGHEPRPYQQRGLKVPKMMSENDKPNVSNIPEFWQPINDNNSHCGPISSKLAVLPMELMV